MWKDIPTWEDTHEINENGEVRNKITGNYIKGDINNAGYYRVCLYKKPLPHISVKSSIHSSNNILPINE